MFAFLFSKIGMYLVGGVLVAALVGGGYLYVGHLRTENLSLKAQVVTLQRVNEIYEHDAETDKVITDEKKRVDSLTPDQLESEFQRLRDYGKGKGDHSKPAGN
jgi:hypothetical protein